MSENENRPDFDALVVGGGPAGLACALALATTGVRTAIVAPPHRPIPGRTDNRTAALFTGSIELLRRLDAFDHCLSQSAPITAIQIIDDTGALLRAPDVMFSASDAGLDAFGYNVPNLVLVEALTRAATELGDDLTIIESAGVEDLAMASDRVVAKLREGNTVSARLIAAADGRKSICRDAAHIETSSWAYDQSAITCSFAHSRDHNDISTEFHRRSGPCTTVPLPGNNSSLVMVERPGPARRLAELDDEKFRAVLEERLHGLLGSIGDITSRVCFPLSGLRPDRFAASRVALVGEAAHVIPPIGAQGLNLGLRDGAALADCVSDALAAGTDIGGDPVMLAYDEARSGDVTTRIWGIDLVNRSLLSGFVPVQLIRGAGLFALRSIAPLRRHVVREGLQPAAATPRLMRPGGAIESGKMPAPVDQASRGA